MAGAAGRATFARALLLGFGAGVVARGRGVIGGSAAAGSALGGGVGAATAGADGAAATGAAATGASTGAAALGAGPRARMKVSSDAAAAEASDEIHTRRFEERCTCRKSAAATTLKSAPRGRGGRRWPLSVVVGASVEGGAGALGPAERIGFSGDRSKLMVAAGRS
jgi:hypothetical protein